MRDLIEYFIYNCLIIGVCYIFSLIFKFYKFSESNIYGVVAYASLYSVIMLKNKQRKK